MQLPLTSLALALLLSETLQAPCSMCALWKQTASPQAVFCAVVLQSALCGSPQAVTSFCVIYDSNVQGIVHTNNSLLAARIHAT